MKTLLAAVAFSSLLASTALAQNAQQNTSQGTPQTTQQNAAPQNSSQADAAASRNSLQAAQQIQQDLRSAGFTDIKVVAESFVVQAKTRDGNPVLMTIGPHGMSVFEAVNAASSGSASSNGSTTGSSGSQGSSQR